ncbi:helix-turn-helix domain-containing protein [Sediminibacillus massiliensis]|uniref:helix-turn-helix transcriptional regulator n=1 Tax=Sediminibacillus massiliensis TaxID=1926277 RepID=UPI0009882EE2
MTGKTVRVIRLYHKLSQEEFAERVSVSQQLVSRIENGVKEITPRTKVRILREFPMNEEIRSLEGEL